MDNILIVNKKTYNLEKVWRKFKTDYTRDSKGTIYPYPKKGKTWNDIDNFINLLKLINNYIDIKKHFILYEKPRSCLLCGKKNITTKRFYNKDIMWEDGLIHYIKKHYIEPSMKFKIFVYQNNILKKLERTNINRIKNKKEYFTIKQIQRQNIDYVVITKNQLHILDALMIHGGFNKKYEDNIKNMNIYSEHAGTLDFDNNRLSKIIVSGKTNRIDTFDDEIYLPSDMEEMLNYEYIFHTHPPTPRPGGRVEDGVLYEFPSIGDIYHFIDHHNCGNVIGSLIITAEGLYNIRKKTHDTKNIVINDDLLFKNYQKIFKKVQDNSIKKYGTKFTNNYFFSTIAQDNKYINDVNDVLNKFNIHIDFYSRKKDGSNMWYIDTVFLMFRKNKKP